MIITCLIVAIIVLPLVIEGIISTRRLRKLLKEQAKAEQELNKAIVEYIMHEYEKDSKNS